MKSVHLNQYSWRVWICLTWMALLCASHAGCISCAGNAVPAYRLNELMRLDAKSSKAPIDLSLLGQEVPAEYLLGPGDLLSIYVYGVLPPDPDQAPVVQTATTLTREYYPPGGELHLPALGLPIEVDSRGQLTLPVVGSLNVQGMTLPAVREAIVRAYEDEGVLQEGRDRTTVTLLKRRVHRVVVIREDAGSPIPQTLSKPAVPYTKKGQAQVVDLPAFENDVLHALAATGGLPGIDAKDEVWIFRNKRAGFGASPVPLSVPPDGDLDAMLERLKVEHTQVTIPLGACPGEPLAINPQDVVLNDGDVVFLPPRHEYFYTGGLLAAGQIPMPRDRDLDVVEAISMAGGSVGGPGGASAAVFRAGAGPGNIIPPTRVLVLRKVEPDRQILIRVDLARALRDPKERILIQPNDVVMLYYKPLETTGNVVLNFFNFNWNFNPPVGE